MGAYYSGSVYTAPHFTVDAEQRIKEIFFAQPQMALKLGVTLAALYPRIDVGDVLGRITATGKYRRMTRCLVKNATLLNATTLVLTDELGAPIESPFVPGEVLDIDSGGNLDASVTLTSQVNASGTLTVPAMGHAHSAGVVVKLHTPDGSEVAVGVAGHPYASAGYTPALPEASYLLALDGQIDMLCSGCLVRSKLRGICDATTKTELGIQSLYPAFDAYRVR